MKLINKIFSWVLIVLISIQPTLLQAQNIQVVGSDTAPRPRVDQSYNGTTVLNINTPNSAGVSHDVYSVFEAEDLIINNSAVIVDTQIGGYIEGNPYFVSGQSATKWIGEVVGGNQTQLNGILEVAGNRLDVILANEFGITCNGCGFINTGRTTLTTGSPLFSANGELAGFDVKQGLVTVGPLGLNPESRLGLADTSRVDVIARAAAVYGKMRAQNLNVVTGANNVSYDWSYDPDTGTVTGVTQQDGIGPAPALAVDVAALGGMYADAIHLVATEKGVGVNIDGEMASSSNIALYTNGKLTLGAPKNGHVPKIKSKKKIKIRSQGPVLLEGSITSEDGDIIDIKATEDTLVFKGEATGGAISLESAGLADIAGSIDAQDSLKIESKSDSVIIQEPAELKAKNVDLLSALDAEIEGKITAKETLTISALQNATVSSDSELSGLAIDIEAGVVNTKGIIGAIEDLTITSNSGNLTTEGSLTASEITLSSVDKFINTGVVAGAIVEVDAKNIENAATISAGSTLTLTAEERITNVATFISGDDLNLFADEVLNQGGIIWANDQITIAKDASLTNASILQNSQGRIEAFQGDLIVRANEVHNLGIAPTLEASEIIKWTERGNSGPVNASEEITKLIDDAYLDANGNILPQYAEEYSALWADLVLGGDSLSAESQTILKSSVVTPSGTSIKDDFRSLWSGMYSKANEEGTTDPADFVKSMLDNSAVDANGKVLEANEEAYAELWQTLSSGASTVSDDVADILDPNVFTVDEMGNPTKTLKADYTDLWVAMSSGSAAAYDIVKILYQDRLADDGKLAEMIAGNNIDIEAHKVANIYGDLTAGNNIKITADEVENKALGASQVLLEVHKKPGCFVCHEGDADYYESFGGNIKAGKDVTINGNLSNETVPSSELSIQDVMNKLNAYIQQEQAKGDADLAGVPAVRSNNLEFHDHREDDYIAPKEDAQIDGREVFDVFDEDNEDRVIVETPSPLTPSITSTLSVDQLLVNGLNTVAETNPEFTQYANFITSNYMMDVDRLQYRDDLLNNTDKDDNSTTSSSTTPGQTGELDYLNEPVQVPARDGSGLVTIYPRNASLKLDNKGALIGGENISITGDTIDNNGGDILASNNTSINATIIKSANGKISADGGQLVLDALLTIELEETELDAHSIDIVSGLDFVGKGVAIKAKTDAKIASTYGGVTLTALTKEFDVTRGSLKIHNVDQKLSSLDVGGNLSIVSAADMEITGVKGDIAGKVSLISSGNLLMGAVQTEQEIHRGGSKNGLDIHNIQSHVTELNAGGDFVALAGGAATLVGTQIDTGGKATLAATEGVVLAAAQDITSYEKRTYKKGFLKKKSSKHAKTTVINKGVSISAANDIDVIAETGDLITAGTEFTSNGGDINLTATEGKILAGTYTDVFQETKVKKKSYLGGLISSSSSESILNKYKTGTQALASLDLSLVSGSDTELVGAKLSAGGQLNINVGGNLAVEAAINEERRQFFSNDMGWVTMTTITENSFKETAVLTEFMAGLGISFDVEGDTYASLYNYSGVDAPLPEDVYPEELLALQGLHLLNQELADEYFYDEKTALSPAFKALVALAVGAWVAPHLVIGLGLPTSGVMGAAANSFVTSFVVGSIDGAVSGDFDIGDILKDAAFSGVTAGLTSAINLDTFIGEIGADSPLSQNIFGPAFGSANGLTVQNLLDGAIDGAINSALSSAVYKTDFMDGFTSSVLNTVINLTLADVQTEIGDYGELLGVENWEGSPTHALLHAVAGCAAGAASAGVGGGNAGNGCASGAAGGLAQSLYAGSLDGTELSNEEEQKRAQFIGALAGFAFSGGDGANVSMAGSVALSGIKNNRQLHTLEAKFIKKLSEGKTEEEIKRIKSAACFLVKCAAGIPENDPYYKLLLQMQTAGAKYTDEINQLSGSKVRISKKSILGDYKEDVALFEYTWLDRKDDLAGSYRRYIDPTLSGAELVIGSAEAAGSIAGGVGLCVAGAATVAGTVAGCGGGVLLATTGGTDGYLRAKDGTSGLIAGVTGTAQHYAGADVLNSFDPNFNGGSYLGATSKRFAGDVIGAIIGKYGFKAAGFLDDTVPSSVYKVDATNRATTQQLSDAQRQLDDLSASLQGQRNPPATAIGAVDPQTGRVVTATSGDIPTTIHPQLQQMADDLGGVGVRTGCGNVLGRCAEFRAANDLLLGNPNLNLSDIGFTPAVRPRTGQIIPRCENCVNVFGVE